MKVGYHNELLYQEQLQRSFFPIQLVTGAATTDPNEGQSTFLSSCTSAIHRISKFQALVAPWGYPNHKKVFNISVHPPVALGGVSIERVIANRFLGPRWWQLAAGQGRGKPCTIFPHTWTSIVSYVRHILQVMLKADRNCLCPTVLPTFFTFPITFGKNARRKFNCVMIPFRRLSLLSGTTVEVVFPSRQGETNGCMEVCM